MWIIAACTTAVIVLVRRFTHRGAGPDTGRSSTGMTRTTRLGTPVLLVAALGVAMTQTIVLAVLPIFGSRLEVSAAAAAWLLTGFMSAMFGVGGALGMVLAGPIVDVFGTPMLFWLSVGLGLVALAGAAAVREPDARAAGSLDVGGALLLSGILVAVLLVVSQGRTWGWGSAATLATVVAAVALTVGFVLVELRVPARPSISACSGAGPSRRRTSRRSSSASGCSRRSRSSRSSRRPRPPPATGSAPPPRGPAC
jgi:hypothetical protein